MATRPTRTSSPRRCPRSNSTRRAAPSAWIRRRTIRSKTFISARSSTAAAVFRPKSYPPPRTCKTPARSPTDKLDRNTLTAGRGTHGGVCRPASERAGVRRAAVFDRGRPVAHLRPDERRQPGARLVFHAGRVFRAVDLQDHRQLLVGARAGADAGDRARRSDGVAVPAAALSTRPSRSGVAHVLV